MRLFKTEKTPSGEERWYSHPDGRITREVVQSAASIDGIMSAARDHRQDTRHRNMKYQGSIPMTVASQWAQEWGVKVFSKEWQEKAAKRVQTDEYRFLAGR